MNILSVIDFYVDAKFSILKKLFWHSGAYDTLKRPPLMLKDPLLVCTYVSLYVYLSHLLVFIPPRVYRLTLGFIDASHAHLVLVWKQVEYNAAIVAYGFNTARPQAFREVLLGRSRPPTAFTRTSLPAWSQVERYALSA